MGGSSRHGSRARARTGGRDAGRPSASSTPTRATGVPMPDRDRLVRLLEPVVRAMDMDLESVNVTAVGRRRLLRVVVDADNGVSLDDIALASRELSARLDRSDQMGEHPYTLEVSSPGVDRPLTQPRHWRRALGRLVVVPVADGHGDHEGNGGGQVSGRVVASSDQGVTIERDGVAREFPYAELGAGRIQVEFGRLDDSGSADADAVGPGVGAEED
jgi:ribosome maturation factor RimP